MERALGGYIGTTPAINAMSRPGVATMEQTLEALEKPGSVPTPASDALDAYVTLYIDGETPGGTVFDRSGRNHAVFQWNNCVITEDDKVTGSSSIFFNGNSSFIEIPSSYDLYVGTSNFTIELWFKTLTLKEQAFISKEQNSSGTSGLLFYLDTNYALHLLVGNGSSWVVNLATFFYPEIGRWYHIALSRKDEEWAIFVDGNLVRLTTSNFGTAYGQTSRPFQIGRYLAWNNAAKDFHGYMDQIRMTEKAVRYWYDLSAGNVNFAVPTSAYPTSIAGDSKFRDVTLLLSMDGTNGSTTFTDSSQYSRTVTPSGNASISTAQSKFGGASAFFDGNGDYLTIAESAQSGRLVSWHNSLFTVEMWVNVSTFTQANYGSGVNKPVAIGDMSTGGTNNWSFGPMSNGTVRFAYFTGAEYTISTTATLSLNTWHHLTLVSSYGYIGIFIDGVLSANGYITGTSFSSTGNLLIGYNNGASYHGYIDDLRITRGIHRYMRQFTPPGKSVGVNIAKTGDPYFQDTGLLLHGDGTDQSTAIIDSSRRNFPVTRVSNPSTLTVNGTPIISTTQSKFGGASGYFDGSGDYLTIAPSPGSIRFSRGDFTIEVWVYPLAAPTANWTPILSIGGSGGGAEIRIAQNINNTGYGFLVPPASGTTDVYAGFGTLPLFTWSHLALTRKGNMQYFFKDGVLIDSRSVNYNHTNIASFYLASNPYGAGDGYFNGYIDSVRITKGVARYTAAFTPPTQQFPTTVAEDPHYSMVGLLLNMNGDDRSNQFIDSSIGARISTSQSKFGGSSIYFNNGSHLSIPDSDAFAFGVSDFTIEAWVFPTEYAQNDVDNYFVTIACSDVSGSRGWILGLAGTSSSFDYLNLELFTSNAGQNAFREPYLFELNKWYHVAGVRQQGRVYLFVNGKLLNKDGTAFSSAIQDSSSTLKVGALDYDGTYKYYFTGYIEELRITKNVGRYLNDFTPPTAPFPDVYRSGSADPYAKNVSFLLHGEGSNGSTLIRDSSYIDYRITLQGNTNTSTANKKYGSSSLYFDGSGDYLDLPQEIFRFEREDFTIEYWVKLETNTQQWPYQMSSSNWSGNGGFYSHVTGAATGWGGTGTLTWNGASSGANGANMTSITGIRDNTWHHVAITRAGANHAMWIDGIPEAYGYAASANYTGNQSRIFASSDLSGNLEANTNEKGYLDEMRITRGIARYSAAVSLPTTGFTSDANTSLLIKSTGTEFSTVFTDSSSNALALTSNAIGLIPSVNGNAKISTTQSKFGGSSLYLAGPSDYLTFASSSTFNLALGDFTVELWVYISTIKTATIISGGEFNWRLQLDVSGRILWVTNNVASIFPANVLNINQWYHIAVSKTGATTTLYIDGTSVGTTTNVPANTNAITYIGYNPGSTVWGYSGYIDSIRITKEIGRYPTAFTPPTAEFSADPSIDQYSSRNILLMNMNGANNSTTFIDTKYPSYFSARQKKFNNTSIYFDGATDLISTPNNAAFQFGTGDFTVEAWVYPTNSLAGATFFSNLYQNIIGQNQHGTAANASFTLYLVNMRPSAQITSGGSGVATCAASYTIPLNAWTHLAYTRTGTIFRLYVNGVLSAQATSSASVDVSTRNLTIGADGNNTSFFQGYLDEVRVTKGQNRYPLSFTPPTAAFPDP